METQVVAGFGPCLVLWYWLHVGEARVMHARFLFGMYLVTQVHRLCSW